MKTLLTAIFLVLTFSIYAQETTYTLNGKLGIETQPAEKLQVNGNSKLEGQLVVSDDTYLKGDTQMEGAVKMINLPENSTGQLLLIDTDGSVRRMPPAGVVELIYDPEFACNGSTQPVWNNEPGILYTGVPCPTGTKVGINTNAPAYNLDVDGNSRIQNGLKIGSPLDPQDLFKLDVLGTSRISNRLQIGDGDGFSDYKISMEGGDGSGLSLRQNTTELRNSLLISNNDKNIFRIYSTGQLSTRLTDDATTAMVIKDSEDEEVFFVSKLGEVICTKVVVQMSPFWPDYVFEKDYKLMSLRKLEEYINKNKHLPNMPSSTEVAEKGGDLGEINRVLVEKVEELSLYVIDLQKQMNELKAQLENK